MCEFHQIFISQEARIKVKENGFDVMKINSATYDGGEKGGEGRKSSAVLLSFCPFSLHQHFLDYKAKFISLSSFTHTQLAVIVFISHYYPSID